MDIQEAMSIAERIMEKANVSLAKDWLELRNAIATALLDAYRRDR